MYVGRRTWLCGGSFGGNIDIHKNMFKSYAKKIWKCMGNIFMCGWRGILVFVKGQLKGWHLGGLVFLCV